MGALISEWCLYNDVTGVRPSNQYAGTGQRPARRLQRARHTRQCEKVPEKHVDTTSLGERNRCSVDFVMMSLWWGYIQPSQPFSGTVQNRAL